MQIPYYLSQRDETSSFFRCWRKKLKHEDEKKKTVISRSLLSRPSFVSYSISISLSYFSCYNLRKTHENDTSFSFYLKLETIPTQLFSHSVLHERLSATSTSTSARTKAKQYSTKTIPLNRNNVLDWGKDEIKVVITDSNRTLGALCLVSLWSTHVRKHDAIVGSTAVDMQGFCKLDDVNDENNNKNTKYDSCLYKNGVKEGDILFSASISHHL